MRSVLCAVCLLVAMGAEPALAQEGGIPFQAEQTVWAEDGVHVVGFSVHRAGWVVSAESAVLAGDSAQLRGVTAVAGHQVFAAVEASLVQSRGAWILRGQVTQGGQVGQLALTLRVSGYEMSFEAEGDPAAASAELPAYDHRRTREGLEEEGGSQETEAAVSAALRWLAAHQSPDGRWDGDGWQQNCSGPRCQSAGGGWCTENGDGRYDAGLTALALLALLGQGNTSTQGEHADAVQRGLRWLVRQQRSDGSVGFDHGETIYNHALATTALCEAYAMTGDEELRGYAEKAVRFCVEAQNPGLGWKYGTRSGRNDTCVTGWMVQALQAGQEAGFEVPQEAWDGARNWFTRATDSMGQVGYETPGGGSAYLPQNEDKYDQVPVMSAVSVRSRLTAGESREERALSQGTRHLLGSLPTWPVGNDRQANFYYWHYGSEACFQMGGQPWATWNEALQGALLPRQRRGGCVAGSWDGRGEWCLAGGRVYATALNALTLETYYRHRRR
jgi:hypothetical protein